MARMVARARLREGRGIGERLAEIIVYVAIAGGLAYGGHWYFMVYSRSPGPALQRFVGSLKAGDAAAQYDMLDSRTRGQVSKADYEDKNTLAHGLAERIATYTITSISEQGDRAQADVSLSVRDKLRDNLKLYEASATTYRAHFVLVREADGWRIALTDPKTRVEDLAQAAGTQR